MIEPGTYMARALPAEVGYGESQNGNEQISVPFVLLDESGAPRGERITWIGTFASPASTDLALKSLKAAGWDGVPRAELTGLGSKDVELVIETERSEKGTLYAVVKYVNEPGGGRFTFKKPLDAGGKARLFQKIKAHQLANANGSPAPAPAAKGGGYGGRGPSPQGGGYGGAEDDIPFVSSSPNAWGL